VYDHPGVNIVELFCPHCSALLSVELYLADEPLRCTFRRLEDARADGYDAVAEFQKDPEAWISF
jgi:hypothetical protein